mmetsp:Transcript_80109/g.206162  ORF Transcript_80109/g.206162 Transcript_80109/m.206162 type:complete len:81 (+) Transcript_80109:202-444(+)
MSADFLDLIDLISVQAQTDLMTASHNYLMEKFSWQWHYYLLTDEGMITLVQHVPVENFQNLQMGEEGGGGEQKGGGEGEG